MSKNRTFPIYTIGHSHRTLDEFIRLLRAHKISTVVDIRRFPGSRKFPHFNRDNLEVWLPKHGMSYVWLQGLGGFRHGVKRGDSPHKGLASPGLRAYADYMDSDEFARAVSRLIALAQQSRTAYACAEAVYWRCHRMILSDYLVAQGFSVLHILGSEEPISHRLTDGAVVTTDGRVTYPTREDVQRDLFAHSGS